MYNKIFDRSSRPELFCKKSVLRNFSKFTRKDLCQSLSSLRQFLATKSPLKMMKKTFYFTLKTLFVLKMFKFLS